MRESGVNSLAVITACAAFVLLRAHSQALGRSLSVLADIGIGHCSPSSCCRCIPPDVWPGYLAMQERVYALVRGRQAGELSPDLDVQAGAPLFVGGGHTVALFRFAGGEAAAIERLIDHLIRSITGVGFGHR